MCLLVFLYVPYEVLALNGLYECTHVRANRAVIDACFVYA